VSKMNCARGIVLLALGLAVALSPIAADADSGAQAAARAAQAKYGGRVLAVERRGDRYRVKLLRDSGKVKVVNVPAADSGRAPEAGEREAAPKKERQR